MTTTNQTVLITGNTYPVKDALKALGAKWDGDAKGWRVPATKGDEARRLVANAPQSTPTPGQCLKCKGPVKAPYTVCFGCKSQSEGKCVKCGGRLSDWERKHGVKRCGDCREGGGNYRNGQSYYDSRGNFVLGDDD